MKSSSLVFFCLVLFVSDSKEFNSNSCGDIEDDLKFDCFPRGQANEKECISRRCCWKPNITDNVPSCFYPKSYSSYKVVGTSKSFRGNEYHLNLTEHSIYPRDIKELKVIVIQETRTRLRIKPTYLEDSFKGFANEVDYKVVVNEDPFGIAVIRRNPETIIFDSRNIGGFTFSDQFIQISALLPSNYIYGLGEHRNNFLLTTNWTVLTLFNHDPNAPKNNTNLYGSHPIYLCLEGQGRSHGVFLLNSNAMDIILQPAPAITYRVIGGVLDFYYFLGPSPSEVIKQYLEVIGNTFIPPYWTYGYHLTRYGLSFIEDAIELWRRNYETELPYEGVWSDIDYMNLYNDFTVSTNYTGLSLFVDFLHMVGMKYVLILDPGVASREPPGTYPPFDDGKKIDIFIKNSSNLPLETMVWNKRGGTVFPDFSNPKTQPYWKELLINLYKQVQYDGIWLDLNEIGAFIDGSLNGCITNEQNLENPPYLPMVQGGKLSYRTICMSAKRYNNTEYNLHNLNGFLETKVTYESLISSNSKKRPFILARSTFPGSGNFSAHWTGDTFSTWDDMKHTVKDIQSFSLFGIPMIGADLCGFHDNTTVDLCRRWSQLGSFYPFTRNHNDINTRPQDPAALGLVVDVSKYMKFRYHLLPFLNTMFWYAHNYGETVVRALLFEFPLDTNTYNQTQQFLWGPAILIAPVLDEGQEQVTVYFPEEIWYDARTFTKFQSTGESKTISAPMDHIPVYFRAGYIIPWQYPSKTIAQTRKNPFGLYVPLNSAYEANGTLFWDDGEGNYLSQEYVFNFLEFSYQNFTLRGSPLTWNYVTKMVLKTIKVMGIDLSVQRITINGKNHKDFFQNKKGKVSLLEIDNTKIDLSKPFIVKLS